MIKRTHLAIGLAVALYFSRFVVDEHKLIFLPVVLIATLLPDIDSAFSNIGRRKIFRPIQLFFKHRGPLHSLTFLFVVSMIFAFFYPVIALPFFLGYFFHLLADSFTVQGIRPFWPMKFQSNGVVKTGSFVDRVLFGTFLIIDVILLIVLLV